MIVNKTRRLGMMGEVETARMAWSERLRRFFSGRKRTAPETLRQRALRIIELDKGEARRETEIWP